MTAAHITRRDATVAAELPLLCAHPFASPVTFAHPGLASTRLEIRDDCWTMRWSIPVWYMLTGTHDLRLPSAAPVSLYLGLPRFTAGRELARVGSPPAGRGRFSPTSDSTEQTGGGPSYRVAVDHGAAARCAREGSGGGRRELTCTSVDLRLRPRASEPTRLIFPPTITGEHEHEWTEQVGDRLTFARDHELMENYVR